MGLKQESRSDPWGYIRNTLTSIEDYYGINFTDGFISGVASSIVNELLDFGSHQLPRQVYAMCIDGKIRKGKLNSRLAIDMMAYRPVIKAKTITSEQWETILTKTDARYTYCFETSTFHPEIPYTVGLYMMKHELSKNIYSIVLNNTRLSGTNGESAKVFDMYIKKEKSIMTKKDMFQDQIITDETEKQLNIKSDYFAWQYVKKIISENGPEIVKDTFSSEELDSLKDLAMQNDIIYDDLLYRVQRGMSTDEAVKVGLCESEKYGFKYSDKDIMMSSHSSTYSMYGVNYNLLMYIKYLANLEELGVDSFEK